MPSISTKIVEAAERAAQDDISHWLAGSDYERAAQFCVKGGSLSGTDTESLLKRFFLMIWFIENNHLHHQGNPGTIKELIAGAEVILKYCEIRPVSSKFSHLYGRLYRGISQWNLHDGNPWMALWQANLGHTLSGTANGGESLDELLFVADRAFHLGHISHAAALYLKIESETDRDELRAKARLGSILASKLSGDITHALALADEAPKTINGSSELMNEIFWQALLCQALTTKSSQPLQVAWDPKTQFFRARYALTAAILAYAFNPTALPRKLKRASTFKSSFAEIVKGSQEWTLYKMLLSLEACFDEQEDLLIRLKRLGEELATARHDGQPEDMLIYFAAVIRWLEYVKQRGFSIYLIHECAGISLRLSAGASRDVLSLLGEIIGSSKPEPLHFDTDLRNLPHSSGQLLLKLSRLVAKTSLLEFKDHLRKIIRPAPLTPKDRDQYLTQMAELIVAEIGSFKGPVMKLGQILAGIEALPGEARVKIQHALASTRGMPIDVFLKVFKSEQGKTVEQAFRRFDPAPIGVGSMGQVFRAELKDGTPVAVKIHYPGLDASVKAVKPCLSLAMMPIRNLFPKINVDDIAKSWLGCFADECDMSKEAAKHQIMYDTFHNHRDVIIPRVFPELTTRSILVTEFIDGLRMFQFTPYASTHEKLILNRTCEMLHTETISKLSHVQIDPHAGNYLYCQGKVAFFDFGSMLKISTQSAQAFTEIFAAIRSSNVKSVRQACIKHKVFDPQVISDDYFNDVLAPFLMVERHPEYDQNRHQILNFFALTRDDRIRQGLTASAELVTIFLADLFLLMMREGLNLGKIPAMDFGNYADWNTQSA